MTRIFIDTDDAESYEDIESELEKISRRILVTSVVS